MKLSARDLPRYVAKPDPKAAGLLIFGADGARISLYRQDALKAILGANAEEEMRLTRIAAAELRSDPAMLMDAMKAQGFFPGPRAVLVQDAGDGLAPVIGAALAEWQPGDAQIVVTAGSLTAKSKLRKVFEDHASARAGGVYDDPPGAEEIGRLLSESGLPDPGRAIMQELEGLARSLPPGDFRQTIEKLALYKLNDSTPVTAEDIAACAPASGEAAVDDVLNLVAEGRQREIGPVMARLQDQGVTPVTLIINATRHFRALYAAASDPGGPQSGISRLRPPVFGPRRDRMLRQAQKWDAPRLERALSMLVETDLQLRSAGQRAPAMALTERCLLRLAHLPKR